MSAEGISSVRETGSALIEEIGRALAGVMSLDAALERAVSTLVPRLGDMAVVAVGDGTTGRRFRLAHVEPALEPGATRLITRHLDALDQLAARAKDAGTTFRWMPHVTTATALTATRGDTELVGLIEQLQVGSLMVVALQNGVGALGALAVARTGDARPYAGADLALLQVVARRVALGVETARLHETMQSVNRRHIHLERALRTWTEVFHVAAWGAAIVDAPGRQIDVVNPAFARLHGYRQPEDLSRRPFADLLPPEHAPEPNRWEEEAFLQGGAYESVHRRADGRTFPVLVSVTPLSQPAAERSFVVTVQDLTDLKRAEERLRRAQRMEAVGRLAGGVAHEVNNMMTIILGFGDLLARSPELPEPLQRDVDEIRKAAARAGKITQQLLAFSRQQVLQPTDLRVSTVVDELVPVLRLLLPANIRVEVAASPVEAVVRADRAQLEQVLINLAFNARDAMPEGGTIRIATETRYLSEGAGQRLIGVPFPPGEYALLSVIDTGHGMDQETAEQAFEPFFTTKPMGLGTGLGLATVYGIVKQSGGYVWVESTPGEGTTVTVGLPLAGRIARPDAHPDVAPTIEEEFGGTVLIVEDEDGVRELAGRMLEARGYEVVEARNAREALAAMGSDGSAVDLVLTDVVVPDLSVGEMARRIHQDRRDIPILYMSGYAREEVLQRKLIGEEEPFLQKPFTGDELAEGVGRLLRSERPVVEG